MTAGLNDCRPSPSPMLRMGPLPIEDDGEESGLTNPRAYAINGSYLELRPRRMTVAGFLMGAADKSALKSWDRPIPWAQGRESQAVLSPSFLPVAAGDGEGDRA